MSLDIVTPAINLTDGQATVGFLVFFVGLLVAATRWAPKGESKPKDKGKR